MSIDCSREKLKREKFKKNCVKWYAMFEMFYFIFIKSINQAIKPRENESVWMKIRGLFVVRWPCVFPNLVIPLPTFVGTFPPFSLFWGKKTFPHILCCLIPLLCLMFSKTAVKDMPTFLKGAFVFWLVIYYRRKNRGLVQKQS